MKNIQMALQKFGGAMYTPVLFTAFSGMMAGLSIVFLNPTIVGSIANEGTLWAQIWFIIGEGAWTLFRQMPIIFAVGLPIGLAKKEAARASFVALLSYLTFNYFIQSIFLLNKLDITKVGGETGLTQIAGITTYDMSILGAILISILAVYIHNRFIDKELPEFIGVFNGAVFVYVIMFFLLIPIAFMTYFIWPLIQAAIIQGQGFIVATGSLGVFIYTFLERILIPTGLHHLVYQPFQFGPAVIEGGATPAWIDSIDKLSNTSGKLSELFPAGGYLLFGNAKVFGSIGIALSFYFTAKPEKRTRTLGLLIPITLTAILVGVTEPLEFTFLFIAPLLFVVHAFLAASMATVVFFLGLAGDFSNGMINFTTLNYLPLWNQHANTYIMQWVVGVVYIGIYFIVFKFIILKFDLKTPGREANTDVKFYSKKEYKEKTEQVSKAELNYKIDVSQEKAIKMIEALGGAANIIDVSNCATRLRLNVVDAKLVMETSEFKKYGAHGLVKSGNSVQIIIGLNVPQFRTKFEKELEVQRSNQE
ncbi:MAG: alpha-glucoside-specific PTS transporter subunit IIBC [Mycoplasmatales bacterium]